MDSCDFSATSAEVLVQAETSNSTTIRNAVLGDMNCEYFCVDGRTIPVVLVVPPHSLVLAVMFSYTSSSLQYLWCNVHVFGGEHTTSVYVHAIPNTSSRLNFHMRMLHEVRFSKSYRNRGAGLRFNWNCHPCPVSTACVAAAVERFIASANESGIAPTADRLTNVDLTCDGGEVDGNMMPPPCSDGSACSVGNVGVYCQCYPGMSGAEVSFI